LALWADRSAWVKSPLELETFRYAEPYDRCDHERTEVLKKADSLTSRGLCIVALTGVFNWRAHLGTLGDWEDVPSRAES
jgi:hypothetical protein